MLDAARIAHRYIDLWNETGTYLDPLMQGQGHD
jgi:hypothetical protein